MYILHFLQQDSPWVTNAPQLKLPVQWPQKAICLSPGPWPMKTSTNAFLAQAWEFTTWSRSKYASRRQTLKQMQKSLCFVGIQNVLHLSRSERVGYTSTLLMSVLGPTKHSPSFMYYEALVAQRQQDDSFAKYLAQAINGRDHHSVDMLGGSCFRHWLANQAQWGLHGSVTLQ